MQTPSLVATVAVVLCSSYMAIDVAWNYGHNVTGLFYTGSDVPLPSSIDGEPTWRVNEARGYDAQYYHLIAHDPLIERGWERFIDNPRLRWRRIAIPALASATSLLTGVSVHWTYVAAQFVFVWLGSRCLSLYARRARLPSMLGLAFVFIPAVLVSVDRMTVDLALAALVAGLFWYEDKRWSYLILCLAPLVRETGMVLVLAWAAWNGARRQWRPAVFGLACAVPALAWWTYVHGRTPQDGTPWIAYYPFSGLVHQTVNADLGSAASIWLRVAGVTELLALIGLWVAFACVLVVVSRRRLGLPEVTAVLFAAFASLLGKPDIWDSAYAAGRTMSPLLLALMIVALRDRSVLYLTPVLLILPRILLQFEAQLRTAFLGL